MRDLFVWICDKEESDLYFSDLILDLTYSGPPSKKKAKTFSEKLKKKSTPKAARTNLCTIIAR